MSEALLSLSILIGQPPPEEPPVTTLDEIVVLGRPLEEAVERFVGEVTAPPVGRGPARWNRSICVGVVNIRRDGAQALADQVSAVASRVGLEVGDPGCQPNIVVIGTEDGAALARGLVERMPETFRPHYSGAARSSEALDHFQNQIAPVRWWHVSIPMIRGTNRPGVRMPGEDAPMIAGDGLLRSPLRNDLTRVFVIVDLGSAEGIDFRQLGDYVGMVSLAQIDPEAETAGYDTILNLFDVSHPEMSLTDWDMSYLSSLYDAELHQRATIQQTGEVSARMFRNRLDAQDTDR